MKRRNVIRMNDEEIHTSLRERHTMQFATIDHDGWPHLVAMWYALINDLIAFWTYAKSQKALNLRRDARLTCLVEDGTSYEELRGVQVKGQAIISDDPNTIQHIGETIWQRYTDTPLSDTTRQMIASQATKRIGIFVKPVEIATWDHRKLGGKY